LVNQHRDAAHYAAAQLDAVRRSAIAHGHRPTQTYEPVREGKSPQGDPMLLGEVFRELTRRHGWEPNMSVARLKTIWPEIVGAVAAEHSFVEAYADNTLKIRTSSTNWAIQLRLLEPTIRAKITDLLGPDLVTEIIILGPAPPITTTGRYRVPGRGWRDTWG